MKKLLILDSNSLMNRAFYALPPMTNSDGINTNAIYGFMNMLFKMKDEINPDSIIATFDLKAPTFRHKEYADYKAGRNKMPPELAEQFPIIKELLKFMGIKIFEIEGFEADDLIGTVSKFAENNNTEVFVVTGDKDALQLASDSTKIVITKKGVSETAVYDRKTFIDEFEVTPNQFIDVKGLMGDKSDNIPGVPGVGEKTAFKLIKEYGSIEEVLKNIDNIPGKKLKENLENNVEQAIFSKKLATIMREVPIEITLEDINCSDKENILEIKKMLIKLEMKSILSKFKDDTVCEESKVEVKIIDTIEDMKELFSKKKNRIYIDYTLTDASIYSKLELEYLILGEENTGAIINFKDISSKNKEEAIEALKILMEDENIKKVIHDGKNFVTFLNKNKIEIKGFDFDTAIAAYLIDSSKSKYEILELVNHYVGENPSEEGNNLKVILSSYLPVFMKN